MLLGMDVLLLLVVAAGSKRGGGGIEAWEGSDGDLITEALTDDVTEGSPPCSAKNNKTCYITYVQPLAQNLEVRGDKSPRPISAPINP